MGLKDPVAFLYIYIYIDRIEVNIAVMPMALEWIGL